MKRNRRLAMVLAAAVGMAASAVQAQYQITTDGRIREANNMLGSGGYNTTVQRQPNLTQGNFNNAIITGDVTGGRDFRGSVPYTNATAFRGNVPGLRVDNFVKQSSGAPVGGVLQNNAQSVQPYFGPSNAVAPPTGFVQQSQGSGGYVPAPKYERDPGDLRVGQTTNATQTILPKPGQLVMPGPVDPNTQSNTVITASPLYGVRTLNPNANLADNAYLQHSMGGGLGNVRMDPALAQKLRQEVSQPSAAMDNGPIDQQPKDPSGRPAPGDLNNPMRQGFDSPQNDPLNKSSMLESNKPQVDGGLNSPLATGAGTQQRLLGAPKIRSTQYTELEKRLQQYRSVQEVSEVATARDFNQQIRARDAAAQAEADGTAPAGVGPRGTRGGPGAPDTGLSGLPRPAPIGVGSTPPLPTPGGNSSMGMGSAGIGSTPPTNNNQLAVGVPTVPGVAPAVVDGGNAGVKPPPMKIDSLAQGVQGQALSDLLKEAEGLMRKESYSSALEKYDMADLVAPNSPLVQLGRANVELGRTYYARAETSLRQAFMQDQALLMGQYNLRSLLGDDRLAIIVKDLRSISEREATESRPVFLLAYIDYNTGNERRAAAYLDLAEKRAGGKDPLFPLLRKYWSLPKDAGPAELNK